MAEQPPAGPAVIVMARAPRAGEGKTRLRAVLSDDERARLQDAFLRDAVDVALEARLGTVHLAVAPAEAVPWAEREFGDRVAVFPQRDGDLGARMLDAFERVEEQGFGPLLVIGTDAPLLEPRHLRAAIDALGDADVCLGPSEDGGYYLLACRKATAALFDAVPWGTDAVLETTLRLARESELGHYLLETLYDVDTPEDLARLQADLAVSDGKDRARAI